MNRRAFLKGLFATGAAIAVAPVLHVVPAVDYDAVIAKILNDVYAKTLQTIEENLYRNAFGVMARITYADDGGLDYEVLHPAEVYLDCKALEPIPTLNGGSVG